LLALNIVIVLKLKLTKILSLFKSPILFHGISRLGDYKPYDYGCNVISPPSGGFDLLLAENN